jgi:hypothetical protein
VETAVSRGGAETRRGTATAVDSCRKLTVGRWVMDYFPLAETARQTAVSHGGTGARRTATASRREDVAAKERRERKGSSASVSSLCALRSFVANSNKRKQALGGGGRRCYAGRVEHRTPRRPSPQEENHGTRQEDTLCGLECACVTKVRTALVETARHNGGFHTEARRSRRTATA